MALPIGDLKGVDYQTSDADRYQEPVQSLLKPEALPEEIAAQKVKGVTIPAPGKGNYLWQSENRLMTHHEFNRDFANSKQNLLSASISQLVIGGEIIPMRFIIAEQKQNNSKRQPPFLLMLH